MTKREARAVFNALQKQRRLTWSGEVTAIPEEVEGRNAPLLGEAREVHIL